MPIFYLNNYDFRWYTPWGNLRPHKYGFDAPLTIPVFLCDQTQGVSQEIFTQKDS